MLVLMLLAATAWALWRRPAAGFVGAWFFVILAPTSSVLPLVHEAVAERRMYLPLAALAAAVVIGAHAAMERSFRSAMAVRSGLAARRITVERALLVCAAAVLGGMTLARNVTYASSIEAYQASLAHRPGNARLHANLATALGEAGRQGEQLPEYQRAIELDPTLSKTQLDLANALIGAHQLPQALEHIRAAAALGLETIDLHLQKGVALFESGDRPGGLAEFAYAVRAWPAEAKGHFVYGNALAAAGEWPGAEREYGQAADHDPMIVGNWLHLAQARMAQGKREAATDALRKALSVDPNNPLARESLDKLINGAAQRQ